MATLKSNKAQASSEVRSIHAGVTCVVATYSLTATTSAGDVVQMVKVPDGAVLVDFAMIPSFTGSAGGLLSVGDGGANARYFGTLTASATALVRATKGVGYQYDLSDGDPAQYDTIDVRFADAVASAGSITLIAWYVASN